jgi:hypothetical protein
VAHQKTRLELSAPPAVGFETGTGENSGIRTVIWEPSDCVLGQRWHFTHSVGRPVVQPFHQERNPNISLGLHYL